METHYPDASHHSHPTATATATGTATMDLATSITLATLGHASMIMPPARNSIDSELPAWSHGKHPETGVIEPYNCACTNGTEAECNSGQSCFWFSQGCTIGCAACDGNGQRYPSWDHCPGTPNKPPATYLDKKYWTANTNATVGSTEDIWRFNPWRAPGHAPVFDACGMAGGNYVEVFNAGAYNATVHAKQGDLGSKVLKPRPSGTVWKRGDTVKARWQMTARHGGGYQFRLCPADAPLTEACFQKTPIPFAKPARHRVLFKDREVDLPALVVGDESPAAGWMRMPFPNFDVHPCDYAVPAGSHCGNVCPKCGPPEYAADAACPTPCSKQFPGLPDDVSADPAVFPEPLPRGGDDFHSYAVEDSLVVPSDLPAGDYVLGWRWDAEMTSQVWSTCTDITIV